MARGGEKINKIAFRYLETFSTMPTNRLEEKRARSSHRGVNRPGNREIEPAIFRSWWVRELRDLFRNG